MKSYQLCTTYDEFIIDKCIWIVELNDGTTVFQDDGRPGTDEPSAWKRLGAYIFDHPHNAIKNMRLRFGTHIVELPCSQPCYFYSRGLIQATGKDFGLDFHIVGWPSANNVMACHWYKSPELLMTQVKYRNFSDCKPGQIIGLTTPSVVI